VSLHLNIRAHPFLRVVIIKSANAPRITEKTQMSFRITYLFAKLEKGKSNQTHDGKMAILDHESQAQDHNLTINW
jgi:hypothetical protein